MSLPGKIAVVGQGYVGLPLALAAVNADFKVVGIDTDISKVEFIKSGKSPVEDISNEVIERAILSQKYEIDSRFDSGANYKIILICVPTPLSENHEPDLGILKDAAKTVGKAL